MEQQYSADQAERLVKAKEAQARAVELACAAFIHLADAVQKLAEAAAKDEG